MTRRPCATWQGGWMTSEYLLLTLLMSAVLFLPMPPLDHSLLELVIDAIRSFQTHSLRQLSQP